MNLFMLYILPASIKDLKQHITHVVRFYIVAHIWIEWFWGISVKKYILPKEIGKLLIFLLSIFCFTSELSYFA